MQTPETSGFVYRARRMFLAYLVHALQCPEKWGFSQTQQQTALLHLRLHQRREHVAKAMAR